MVFRLTDLLPSSDYDAIWNAASTGVLGLGGLVVGAAVAMAVYGKLTSR